MKKKALAFLLSLAILVGCGVPGIFAAEVSGGANQVRPAEYPAPGEKVGEGEITVTFYDADLTTVLAKQYLTPGDQIVYPNDPLQTGAYFVGWSYDGATVLDELPEVAAQADMNFYAVYASYQDYVITIRFVDESGVDVSQPYTIHLASVLSFEEYTTIPSVYGYSLVLSELTQVPQDGDPDSDPDCQEYYILENDETVLVTEEVDTSTGAVTHKLKFNVKNLEEDREYQLVYSSGTANYTVQHLWQNVDNDDYTLKEAEVFSGPVGTWTQAEGKAYEGFTQKGEIEQLQIAAGDTTVVKVYYDRNYYMLTFDANGGVNCPEPVYARYGAAIGAVVAPSWTGHTFQGWSPALPSTMPAENLKLVAQWKAGTVAKATVVIWGENADDENYSYLSSTTVDAAVGSTITVKNGQLYVGSGRIATCGKEAHTHTYESSYTTGVLLWAKTYYCGGCYPAGNASAKTGGDTEGNTICGKEEHTHTADCYAVYTGDDPYYFVRSDTATVSADGTTVVNVYYDRTEYTWSFSNTQNSAVRYTITDKWGADVYAKWLNVCNNMSCVFYNSDDSSSITIIRTHMTTQDVKFWKYSTTSGNANYYYYVQVIDGTQNTDSSKTYKQYNGVWYERKYIAPCLTGLSVADVAKIPITGFTYTVYVNNRDNKENSSKIYSEGINFYYSRNKYPLQLMSGGNSLGTDSLQYEAPLSTSKYAALLQNGPATPPSTVDSDYVFAGWYTNSSFAGTSVTVTDHMPLDGLLLYAKWVPPEYKVDSYKVDFISQDNLITSQTVEKNQLATEPEEVLADGYNPGYVFVGWFYEENGTEKPFSFSLPITKNYTVYAKWSKDSAVAYTIEHIFVDENGEETVMVTEDRYGTADGSVTGYARFDLEYQEEKVYLNSGEPTYRSLKLTGSGPFVIQFRYSRVYILHYTVQCEFTDGTETVLYSETTTHAVETVYAPVFPGYAPDKPLQITLLSQNTVLTFTYSPGAEITYTVEYYLQTADQTGYQLDETRTVTQTATKGNMIFAPELKIQDFTVNYDAEGCIWRTVAREDAVLRMYYDRKADCQYTVYCYEWDQENDVGTTIPVCDPKVVENQVCGASVTVTAPTVPGYQVTGDTEKTIELTSDAVSNVVIFYYLSDPDTGSLTIYKEADKDMGKPFVFHISGIDESNQQISLTVTVKSGESVTVTDLPLGRYSVSEDMAWASQYTSGGVTQTLTVTAEDTASYTFTNYSKGLSWFQAVDVVKNIFNTKS